MEAGEEVHGATLREIHEEVGLEAADLTLVHSNATPFIRGDEAAPKQLMWFSLYYWSKGDLSNCKLDYEAVPEFTEVKLWTWGDFMSSSVDFKKEFYVRVRESFEPMISSFIAKLQQQPVPAT